MNDLGHLRKSYDKNKLDEKFIPAEPMLLFNQWFTEVEATKSYEETNAMTVSTIGLDGFPKSRVVLLKQITNDGFVFYTNYDSEKGKAIASNPNVCLSFFWEKLERQVIIKGVAEKVAYTVSDKYFDSRPAGSQIGAIVSHQSEVIASREVLEKKLLEIEKNYADKTISRPENWGGFEVKPYEIEFWQGRPNRLHDRIRFSQELNNSWKIERLSP